MKQNKEIPAGYKDSPLGIIPEEWEVKKLGSVFSQITTFSFSRDQMSELEQKLRYVHYGDIHKNIERDCINLKIDELPFLLDDIIPDVKMKDSNFPYLINGDILLTDASEDYDGIGKALEIVDTDNKKVIGGLHTIGLRCKTNELAIGFGRLIFKNCQSSKSLKRIAQGTKVYSISYNHIAKLDIVLPPTEEQAKIIEILNCWDEAIEKHQILVEKLEMRKRGLMQQLLNKKKQLREYVAEWQIVKLGDCIREFNEKPKEKIKYEILTSSNKGLVKQTDYYGDNRITNREEVDYNVIPPNYVTYRSRSDDGLFTFNKNTYGIYGLVSGYYPVFTALNCNIDFLVLFLNYFKTKLSKFSTGTSQLVLSFSSLISAKFKLPNYEEQTAIAEVFATADQEINSAKAKLNSLIIQKKGLMQQLLTGKTRVAI